MKKILTMLGLLLGLNCFGQGTIFTYQGVLGDNGAHANGMYDLTFTLYDSEGSPGNLIAGPITNSGVLVTNGLFTVPLDFFHLAAILV